MNHYILQRYRRKLRQYRKFKARIQDQSSSQEAMIVSGVKFQRWRTRLERLRTQLKALYRQLVLAGLGASLSVTLAVAPLRAQEIRFELPNNPFTGLDLGSFNQAFTGPAPALADINGDGDLDLFIGTNFLGIRYFANNNGTYVDSTASTPLPSISGAQNAQPTFFDIDGDNDLDFFLGNAAGTIRFYENRISDGEGFVERTGNDNPLSAVNAGAKTTRVAFVDLDGDGTVEAAFISEGTIANGANAIVYYELDTNTGAFVRNDAANQLAGESFGDLPLITAQDLDNDGDSDLVITEFASAVTSSTPEDRIRYYQNQGANDNETGSGVLVRKEGNESVFLRILRGRGTTTIGTSPIPAFADLDGDQDLDMYLADVITFLEEPTFINLYLNSGTPASPRFGSAVVNNGNISGNSPALADLDGDDDLDLLTGDLDGLVRTFLNQGNEIFVQETPNPTVGIRVNRLAAPTFADLDGDDDLDVFVGENYNYDEGRIIFLENEEGTFTENNEDNPFDGLVTTNDAAKLDFVDIDGDDDLDMFVGDTSSNINYFENRISDGEGFVQRTGNDNPLGNLTYSEAEARLVTPTFVDIDLDGDQDVFIGITVGEDEPFGTILFFENQGDANNPSFSELVGDDNPFNGVRFGSFTDPTFADADQDGDLDLFVGDETGVTFEFKNQSPASAQIAFGGNAVGNGSTVDLGQTDVGMTLTETITLQNEGLGGLQVSNLSLEGAEFTLQNAPSDTMIAAKGSLELTIAFSPQTAGSKTATLAFASNDPNAPDFEVSLTARGLDPTGIFNLQQGQLKIFPNPTLDGFKLSFEEVNLRDYDLKIFDQQGQAVYQEQAKSLSSSLEREVRLPQLQPGTYIIQIQTEEGTLTDRIVIH